MKHTITLHPHELPAALVKQMNLRYNLAHGTDALPESERRMTVEVESSETDSAKVKQMLIDEMEAHWSYLQ